MYNLSQRRKRLERRLGSRACQSMKGADHVGVSSSRAALQEDWFVGFNCCGRRKKASVVVQVRGEKGLTRCNPEGQEVEVEI